MSYFVFRRIWPGQLADSGFFFLSRRFLGGVTRTLNLSYIKAVPIGKSFSSFIYFIPLTMPSSLCSCVCVCVLCVGATGCPVFCHRTPLMLTRPGPNQVFSQHDPTDSLLPPRNDCNYPCVRVPGGQADGIHQGVDDERGWEDYLCSLRPSQDSLAYVEGALGAEGAVG